MSHDGARCLLLPFVPLFSTSQIKINGDKAEGGSEKPVINDSTFKWNVKFGFYDRNS